MGKRSFWVRQEDLSIWQRITRALILFGLPMAVSEVYFIDFPSPWAVKILIGLVSGLVSGLGFGLIEHIIFAEIKRHRGNKPEN